MAKPSTLERTEIHMESPCSGRVHILHAKLIEKKTGEKSKKESLRDDP
ncbi:MAG: hypothetical protein HC945_00515 [Nitrosarchaeum sp.]|nr:hypothetical protein [Nitrosarchaeum sp.]